VHRKTKEIQLGAHFDPSSNGAELKAIEIQLGEAVATELKELSHLATTL